MLKELGSKPNGFILAWSAALSIPMDVDVGRDAMDISYSTQFVEVSSALISVASGV